MTPSSDEQLGRRMRRACTNIIGFGQLLDGAPHPQITEIMKLQYQAYMVGSALHLADMILEHHRGRGSQSGPSTPATDTDLRNRSIRYKTLAIGFDGHHQQELVDETMGFGLHVLRTVGS